MPQVKKTHSSQKRNANVNVDRAKEGTVNAHS